MSHGSSLLWLCGFIGYDGYGSLMAANKMAIPNLDIVTLPLITPIPMERHTWLIPIIHTATHGKGTGAGVKLVKVVPGNELGQTLIGLPPCD